MKILAITAVVHVSNMQRAVQYYQDVLGFKPGFEFGDYTGLVYGEICIHLSGPANPGMKKAPGNAHFCFDCDEVDAYYYLISKNGAIISAPIADRP